MHSQKNEYSILGITLTLLKANSLSCYEADAAGVMLQCT